MITVSVETEQVVHISEAPEASHHRSGLAYIPGTALRGAFAKRWILENGPPDRSNPKRDEFVALFHRDVRWPVLAPPGATAEPLSAMVHKYGRPADCKNHRLDRAEALASGSESDTRKCRSCGSRLESAKGTWVGTSQAALTFSDRTRVGLESVGGAGGRRHRAADGELFSRRGIAGRSPLKGGGNTLTGQIGQVEPWLTALADNGDGIEIRLGGQRSVDGLCRAHLTAGGGSPNPPVPRADHKVILRALSPAMFVDDAGRPSLVPRLGELAAVLGSACRVVGRWVRPTTIGGWDVVSGVPKPEEIGVIAGSTWVVELEEPATVEKLSELGSGIGLRQAEGYGQVAVNPAAYVDQSTVSASEDPPPGQVRGLATNLQRAFGHKPGDNLRWQVGLLLDLASQKASGQTEAEGVVDQAMTRARFVKLSASEREVLVKVADQDAETIKLVATLIRAGI